MANDKRPEIPDSFVLMFIVLCSLIGAGIGYGEYGTMQNAVYGAAIGASVPIVIIFIILFG